MAKKESNSSTNSNSRTIGKSIRRIKKNQVIITTLAMMIAVAGYINYSGKLQEKLQSQVNQNQIIEVDNNDSEPEDISLIEPGTAVLTSGTVNSVVSSAKLSREQVRAKNKESLFEIINNDSLSEASKKDAVTQVTRLTDAAEREMAAELLLEAKGFNNAVVSIVNDCADVVIGVDNLTDVEKTQVEDIVKRKTGISAANITINLCK